MSENFETDAEIDGASEAETDLLGDPVREYRDLRNELRDRVAVLRAAGMERDEIADTIGCSERTLRSYFLPELNEGKSAKPAQVISALYAAAVAGNVSAAKAFLTMSEKANAIPAALKPAKLSEKEAALQSSQTAHEGSEWGELLH